MLLPDGVEKPPVIICLQGHSKGMHISLGRPKYDVQVSGIEDSIFPISGAETVFNKGKQAYDDYGKGGPLHSYKRERWSQVLCG